MSNCCNEYGDCTQGRDCPARTGVILPHQAAHARRLTPFKAAPKRIEVSTVGAYDSHLEWPDTVPPEAGNVRLPPVDLDDFQPLSHEESMELVRTIILLLAGAMLFSMFLGLLEHFGIFDTLATAFWFVVERLS